MRFNWLDIFILLVILALIVSVIMLGVVASSR
jgi:hypothetical protein